MEITIYHNPNCGTSRKVLGMLRGRFARLGLKTLEIDRIALFKQVDTSARFTIIGDWPLRAG